MDHLNKELLFQLFNFIDTKLLKLIEIAQLQRISFDIFDDPKALNRSFNSANSKCLKRFVYGIYVFFDKYS